MSERKRPRPDISNAFVVSEKPKIVQEMHGQSWAANQTNEDRFFMVVNQQKTKALFAVIDGHNGFDVAQLISSELQKSFVSSSGLFLRDGVDLSVDALKLFLQQVDQKLLARPEYDLAVQGACVVLTAFNDGKLVCLSVGDCRCVAGARVNKLFHDVNLSGPMHNASVNTEVVRLAEKRLLNVDAQGGFYVGTQGINFQQLTRAIGDTYLKTEQHYNKWLQQATRQFASSNQLMSWPGKPIITAEPNVDQDECDNVAFVVMGSDGLFDFIDEFATILIVSQVFEAGGSCKEAANALFDVVLKKTAFMNDKELAEVVNEPPGRLRRSWLDDTTIIVARLE